MIKKKIISLILALALVLSWASPCCSAANKNDIREALQNTTIRECPFQDSAPVCRLEAGDPVIVTSKTTNSYGNVWYEVYTYTGARGYAYSNHICPHTHRMDTLNEDSLCISYCRCGYVEKAVNGTSQVGLPDGGALALDPNAIIGWGSLGVGGGALGEILSGLSSVTPYVAIALLAGTAIYLLVQTDGVHISRQKVDFDRNDVSGGDYYLAYRGDVGILKIVPVSYTLEQILPFVQAKLRSGCYYLPKKNVLDGMNVYTPYRNDAEKLCQELSNRASDNQITVDYGSSKLPHLFEGDKECADKGYYSHYHLYMTNSYLEVNTKRDKVDLHIFFGLPGCLSFF